MQEAEKIIHEIEKAIIEMRNIGISLEEGKKLTNEYVNDMCNDNFRFECFHNQELIIGGMKNAIIIIKNLIKKQIR